MALNEREILDKLRDAVVALKDVRAQRDTLLRQKSEPIAIVGMACRFPGDADTPEAFFDLLTRGVDTVTAIPADRWAFDPRHDADPRLQGARWGAFTKNVDLFDAAFFGISPREAERLDPQQRFLLELTWEALERAGIVPATLAGTKTGVFVGILNTDYYYMNLSVPPENQDAYSATGNGHCFAAGRLSYAFGFQGPAVSIDTACSSSLVAAHAGCNSLRSQESDVAIVCGTNLMLHAFMAELIAKTGALAPDGRCKSFDALANGYVRGEGCGVLILKRLSDAQLHGDPIIAVIRGSAINQDGRSTGLTTPNVLAQEAMLEQALANAQLKAEDLGYIEAHGTGTPLGDPIEMDALRSVFGKKRTNGTRLWIGSVKSNVGHLEAAAGLAGLIKAAMALHQEKIPTNLHFKSLNPRISLQGTDMAVVTELVPWPRKETRRRAGVSSFGMSGTNGHVILEDAPLPPTTSNPVARSAYLLPISAKTPDALSAAIKSYADFLAKNPSLSLADIVHTASVRRTAHNHRAAFVAPSNEEFCRLLSSYSAEHPVPGTVTGQVRETAAPKVIFVFPGQGSQWFGMGRELMADEPVFRASLERADRLIQAEAGFSILDQLHADESKSRFGEIDVIQPLLFAFEVALAALWQSWGVVPDCVVGHSMGEVAAAHVAGMLTLEDAVKVICRRSRLMRRLSGQGAMALVELPMTEAEVAVAHHSAKLSAAVSNGPHTSVLSGDPEALDQVISELEMRKVFCRRVKVDVASHSPQVDVLHNELVETLQDLRPVNGTISMISTVTGKLVHGDHLSARYWWNNLRQPVRFYQVTHELMHDRTTIFVELSPHPILLSAIEETIRDAPFGAVAVASLVRQAAHRRVLLESLAKMWVRGFGVDWKRFEPEGRHVVAMPTYPWQRKRYWLDITNHSQTTAPRQPNRQAGHPLLGTSFTTSVGESRTMRIWQSRWSLANLPYLTDHRIGEQIFVPGSAYVEAALAAAREHFGRGPITIEDLVFTTPLVLTTEAEVAIEIALSFESPDHCDFRFSSLSSDESDAPVWQIHARAQLSRGSTAQPALPNTAEIRQRRGSRIDLETARAAERSSGLNIGPAFEGLQELWRDGATLLGRIELPKKGGEKGDDYIVHPILLDSAIRALMVAVPKSEKNTSRVLLGVRTLRFWDSAGSSIWNVGELPPSMALDNAKLTLLGPNENAILSLEGIETGQITNSPNESDFFSGKLFCQRWIPFDLPQRPSARVRGRWLLLCETGEFADEVQRLLTEDGAEVFRVQSSLPGRLSIAGTRTVDPTVLSELAALVAEATNTQELAGIIHCWGLEQNALQTVTKERLLDEQERVCAGALHLVQALMGSGLPKIPPLWLVVRGTQTVEAETEAVGIMQAPLWGLGRAIAAESSDVRCLRLDLDARGDADEVRIFRDILRVHPMNEDEIAIRNGHAFAGRLITPVAKKRVSPAARVHAEGCYLITGGLGGLGIVAAKWLAESGAKYIALMSRSGVSSPAQAQSIHEIEALGARVLVLEADVAIAEQLKYALTELKSKFPPLRGILHAAGFADVGVLEKQSREKFRTVFGPKVVGSWNLYELTRECNLDFFVLYSSMAALFGSVGVSNYVAANAFLDTFASYLRSKGRAATSINWGWFEESGKRHVSQQNAVAAVRGFNSFSDSDGKRLLERVAHEGWMQMGLLSMDLKGFVAANPHLTESPRFSSLVSKLGRRKAQPETIPSAHSQPAEAAGGNDAATSPLDALRGASDTDRLQRVDLIVREQLGHVLRMPASQLNSRDHLQQYGVDSLMTIELRNRLQSLFRVRLSITDIWSQSNIQDIAKFLVQRLGDSPSSTANTHTPTPTPSPAEAISAGLISAGGWLVTHKPRPEAQMRLICFPYAGGGAPIYASWPDHLPTNIEVIAVQPPGRYERIQESPPRNIREIVDALLPVLIPILNLPFALFGHCLGAMMMFEVARRLEREHGIRPIHLFASGASPPQFYLVPNALTRSDDDFEAILRAVGFADKTVLRDDDVIRNILPVVRSDFAVAAGYEYSPGPRLNAPVTAFVGDLDVFAPAHIVCGWQAETSRELSTHTFAGGHYFITPERESVCRIIATDMEHDQGSITQAAITRTSPDRWLMRIEARQKPRLRLFCCPGLGGNASAFEHLASMVPPDVELCAVELPGHGHRANESPLGRFEDLISCISSALTNWIDRPFAFLGIDLGALVLYEVMRRLRSNGGPSPKALIVLGAMAPHLHYFASVHHLPANAFADTLRVFGIDCSKDWSSQRALRADCAALTNYQYRDEVFITTPIVAFVAENDELIPPMSVPAWQRHTAGPFELHRIACTHAELHTDSAVLGTCYFTISEIC